MSDIFLSYKSEDRARAKIIAEALEQQGYSVWLDQKIPPGKTYDDFINEALDSAKCVVVLWSKESVKLKEGRWVRTEATIGDRRGILVPVLIDDVEPPFSFMLTEAARLIDWKGTLPNPEFDLLVGSIAGILGQSLAARIEDKKKAFKEELGDIELRKKVFRDTKIKTQEEEKRLEQEKERGTKEEWINKGIELVSLGKYQEAINALDRALEIDPKARVAWFCKGGALYNLCKYQEAITAFDKTIEIDPKATDAWNYKGGSLANLGKYQEAVMAYDKALEIDPKNTNGWYYKGVALANLGKHLEAITAYDKALEIDPTNKLTWGNKKISLDKLQH